MNVEHIEAELQSFTGKQVIITVPLFGRASISLAGQLEMVRNENFACGFHIANPMGGWAIVFDAESVASINEPAASTEFVKVINLKKSAETA